SSVTATTGTAAASAATECADLPGGARHRERRDLFSDRRRAAVRARDLRFAADELLEVLLAAHADELVDGHRLGSLGTLSDGPQTEIWHMCAHAHGPWVHMCNERPARRAMRGRRHGVRRGRRAMRGPRRGAFPRWPR